MKKEAAPLDVTHLIHHPYTPPADFEAPQAGVFKASTVYFPSVAAMRQREWKDKSAYTYGLHGTPTSYLLEERLCALEGGLQCVLVPSGLSALSTVALATLQTGDEVLLPDNAYGPNKALAEGELKAFGITHQFYDPMHPADLAALGAADGDWLALVSANGRLVVRAKADDTMRPGHLALPHGYGQAHPGPDGQRLVCGPAVNALTSSAWCDPVAGTPFHKHVPVRLEQPSADEAAAAQQRAQQLRAAVAA